MHIEAFEIIKRYENFSYFIIMFSVFAETGFVITPFFPGDTLVFAAGAFASQNYLKISVLSITIPIAAFSGNMLNYLIGSFLGKRLKLKEKGLLSHSNIEKTREFYKKYGSLAVVLSRFTPIFRTLVPFTAGISGMNIVKFAIWNMAASLLWGLGYLGAGYYFGEIPFVKEYFGAIVTVCAVVLVAAGIIIFLIKKRD